MPAFCGGVVFCCARVEIWPGRWVRRRASTLGGEAGEGRAWLGLLIGDASPPTGACVLPFKCLIDCAVLCCAPSWGLEDASAQSLHCLTGSSLHVCIACQLWLDTRCQRGQASVLLMAFTSCVTNHTHALVRSQSHMHTLTHTHADIHTGT